MGKTKKVKNMKSKDINTRTGSMDDVIAQSCGVSELAGFSNLAKSYAQVVKTTSTTTMVAAMATSSVRDKVHNHNIKKVKRKKKYKKDDGERRNKDDVASARVVSEVKEKVVASNLKKSLEVSGKKLKNTKVNKKSKDKLKHKPEQTVDIDTNQMHTKETDKSPHLEDRVPKIDSTAMILDDDDSEAGTWTTVAHTKKKYTIEFLEVRKLLLESIGRNSKGEKLESVSKNPKSVPKYPKSVSNNSTSVPKNPESFLKNPEPCTLFVGNIPETANKKQILKLFNDLGEVIETVRLRCTPGKLKKAQMPINRKINVHPKQSRIMAYIRLTSRGKAQKVMEKAQKQELILADHHLTLAIMANGDLRRDNKKKIFVGNLAHDMQDQEIMDLFSECGQIKSIRVVRNKKTGVGKGFGYVNFMDRSSVGLALKKNGIDLNDRSLRIFRCVQKLNDKKSLSSGHDTDYKENQEKMVSKLSECVTLAEDRIAKNLKKNIKKVSKKEREELMAKKIARSMFTFNHVPIIMPGTPEMKDEIKKKETKERNN